MVEHYEYQYPEVYDGDTFDRLVGRGEHNDVGLAEHLVRCDAHRIPPLDFAGCSVLVRFRKFESDEPWKAYRVHLCCTTTYTARKETTDGN